MALSDTAGAPVETRRRLHAHPEVGWCEFRTTALVADRLRELGYEVAVGPDAVDTDAGTTRPDEEVIAEHATRAVEAGVDAALVERLREGGTGVVASLRRGDGPVAGLRVDMDALPVRESDADDHRPAREGFASEAPGVMHACGHDGHTAIGLGVAERVADADFDGTVRLFFQPAEEGGGGGRAMAASGHLDDVDLLVALHLGLGVPTGTVVTSLEFLAVSGHDVTFTGRAAHSAAAPEEGRNALLAAATATQNLYSISRHAEGATRINVGTLDAGTAGNVVPESAEMSVVTRGETDDLCTYVEERMREVVRGAATTHGVEAEVTTRGRTVSADHDPATAERVAAAVETANVDGVDTVETHRAVSGSEDACYLMQRVRDHGGAATYVGVGTDLADAHHTASFDVDEASLAVGIESMTTALTGAASE